MKKIYNESTISGTIKFCSDMNLIIGGSVNICGSDKLDDYYSDDNVLNDPCGNRFGRALFYAKNCKNIMLCGEEGCIIDGRGALWKENSKDFSSRPCLIRFIDCENVLIKNVKLVNSPAWGIHLQNCQNVRIENVKIISDCNHNNDGIDIDSCKNVIVENCFIDTGDDATVLKATKNISNENIIIKNCTLSSRGAGFKIGTESVGDFNNIGFINNVIEKSEGGSIKIVPTDGGMVDNVIIQDITIKKGTGPIFIANGSRMRTYYEGHKRDDLSKIKRVTIKNVSADVYIREEESAKAGRGVVFVTGTPENKIEKLTVENCTFYMPCGVDDTNTKFSVKELSNEYPEYYTLGTAPAYGAYLRHIKSVDFQNVKFIKKAEDTREEIVAEDVEELNK